MKIRAISPIKHDDAFYDAGKTLDVSKEDADFLIEEGVAAPFDQAPRPAAEAPKAPEAPEAPDKEQKAQQAG